MLVIDVDTHSPVSVSCIDLQVNLSIVGVDGR
jgi:hypothetical protein